MRLRLTHFEGLRLGLPPGWYELPSHIQHEEVGQLLDLLTDALPGIEEVIECSWHDLDTALALGPSTLVFVTVPADVDHRVIQERLAGLSVRLGLYQQPDARRWPDIAWDEIQVKSAIAAGLRKSLGKPGHPLAPFGIAELPIDLLVESTSEPIELLVLAESTIAYALRQHDDGQQIDWRQCARWSIGRRLANRLASARRELRGDLRRCMASARDGVLSTLDDPHEVDELVRLGLAHREEGDAILVPLARLASEHGVVELLDLEGITTPDSLGFDDAKPTRWRATSPTEAIVAFDPLTPISTSADDPWFVDLRLLAPSLQDFGKRFAQQLTRRDRRVRLAVLQQSGCGGSTMIRQLVRELQAEGVICISVRAPVHAGFGFVDLLLRTMSALLTYCEEPSSDLTVPPETLEDLRRWLGEHCLEGELREYVRLGADIMEQARIPSLLMILQRAHGRGPESAERVRVRLALEARVDEMLGQLERMLNSFRGQLSARGLRLCLYYENTARLDAKTIDEVFVAHADDLALLDCHLLFGVDPTCEYLPTKRAVSEVFTILSYPTLTATPEVWTAIVQAVLAARGQLDTIFERPDALITQLAVHAQGSLRRALELAMRACERTPTGLVGDRALAAAATGC